MNSARPIAMASGIMPEATPVELVDAAAQAGFDYGGMWIEPATWTAVTTRDVRARLRDTGMKVLDVEVVWIKPGMPNPDHRRIVDIGLELGAANVLCVSSDPDVSATVDKLGALVEHGRGGNIRVNLEFGLFTEVKTIHDALRIVSAIGDDSVGLLVDALHLERSGGTAEDLATVPQRFLSYCQLCDAPSPGADPSDPAAVLEEAIDGRVALGAGGLALTGLLDLLGVDTPIAIEERSRVLRTRFPNLFDRAAEVAKTSRAYLSLHDAMAKTAESARPGSAERDRC